MGEKNLFFLAFYFWAGRILTIREGAVIHMDLTDDDIIAIVGGSLIALAPCALSVIGTLGYRHVQRHNPARRTGLVLLGLLGSLAAGYGLLGAVLNFVA